MMPLPHDLNQPWCDAAWQRRTQVILDSYRRFLGRELIERADQIAVADCFCWVAANMNGKGCDRPVQNCMMFFILQGW